MANPNRKSLLQEYVDKNGMDGLNQNYVQNALATNGGFGSTSSKDPFIQAYLETRIGGGSPEDATEAGRAAAGMSTPASSQSGANYALESGDAYLDEKTGRVRLYDSVSKAAGDRTYEQYVRETTPEERYAARVRKTTAEQTPTFSNQVDTQPMSEEKYVSSVMNKDKPAILETVGSILRGENGSFLQGGGRTTDWGAMHPTGASAGGDGSLNTALADQTGASPLREAGSDKNPLTGVTRVQLQAAPETTGREQSHITQYFYPEDVNSSIRYQNTSPFEDWQKTLIDEMNTAQENRDFDRTSELLKIYTADDAYDAFLRDRYQKTLPKGADAYKGMQEAISAGDVQAYKEAQNTLRSNGYSKTAIEDRASEMIHQSDKSTKEKEQDLRNYHGLSASDAQATSLMWWWGDTNGKAAADADGNGKLKQDELGDYLHSLENSRTLTQAQAAAVWKEVFPKAKTDYAKWKGSKQK